VNLDELLASFSRAVKETEALSPLLSVGDYVPADQKQSPKIRAEARQLIAGFVYWLAHDNHLSERGLERLGTADVPASISEVLLALEQHFFDVVETLDVREEALPFCRAYLPAATGSYADDFHALLVDRTPLNSYLDVSLTPENMLRLMDQIEARKNAFDEGQRNWQMGLLEVSHRKSANIELVQSRNIADWGQRLRSFDSAESSPGGNYQSLMTSYLRTIDEASLFPPDKVADELIRTYLWHKDGTVQSSVWRVLRTLQPMVAFQGLLSHIVALSGSSEWADELVDLFDSDLDKTILSQMVNLLLDQARDVRLAYSTALHQAERDGSVHAGEFLAALYPNEGDT